MSFFRRLFGSTDKKAPNIAERQARQDVKGLIDVVSLRQDDMKRKDAIGALGKVGGQETVNILTKALKTKNSDEKVVVEPLISALGDQNDDVREAAAFGFAQLNTQLKNVELRTQVVEKLILALKDTNNVVRKYSAEALGKIHDRRAVELLCVALRDSDENVCEAAAQSLGRIGDPRAIEPLANMLDVSKAIYEHAANALCDIGIKSEDLSLHKRVIQLLIDGLKSEYGTQEVATKTLRVIGGNRMLDPLITLLEEDGLVGRQEAAFLLGDMGDPRAIEPLTAALRDENRYVRAAAADALLQMD